MFGLKAKLNHKQFHAEKTQMKMTIHGHKRKRPNERITKYPQGTAPTCILDREGQSWDK